jgi:hypothetical protein
MHRSGKPKWVWGKWVDNYFQNGDRDRRFGGLPGMCQLFQDAFAVEDALGTPEGLVPDTCRALSRAKAHGPGPWARLMGPGPRALAHGPCP